MCILLVCFYFSFGFYVHYFFVVEDFKHLRDQTETIIIMDSLSCLESSSELFVPISQPKSRLGSNVITSGNHKVR